MAQKQLIVVVEGTAAMGPYWQRTLTDYLVKIIRAFCGCDLSGQKPAGQTVEMSLVMFTSHCTYTACLVQRSGWTRDIDVFLSWLFALGFSGGGFNDAAVTEGLIEALMMFPPYSTIQNQQNAERQKHCILIAASNPNPIPSPMSRLQLQSWDQGLGTDNQAENRLCDAQTVSKLFAQRSISLSVISPKLNPLYRAIYNAGKRNPQAADPPIDNANNPYFLVLISENFTEACSALSRPGVAVSMKGPIMKRQPNSMPIIHPPATVKIEPKAVNPMVSGSSIQNIPSASRPSSQGISNFQTTSPISTPQEMLSSSENLHEMKPIVGGISQPSRLVQTAAANVNILNNLSQARQVVNSTLTGGTSIGLQSMGVTPMATMHMSNMISSGVTTSVPVVQSISHSAQSGMKGITLPGTSQVAPNPNPTSFSSSTSNMSGNANTGMSQPMGNPHGGVNIGQPISGMNQGNLPGSQMVSTGIGMNQNMMNNSLDPVNISSGTGTMVHTPGMSQQAQLGGQSIGASNSSSPVMPSSKQNSGPLQGTQSKYVRIWEGSLSGHRQGQHVFITRLEGYRNSTSSETLADNWPQTMQIVRLISQDHMNNKYYTGKADFLVFRAMNQHGFLGQLQDKKLCAVIQLPSQTLLLSVSDKACRLIGMLFPGDMVVFKPQISSQPQQQHQGQAHTQMQQQLQSLSNISHLQQQQQPQSSSNVSHLQQHQQPQSSSNVSHLQQQQSMVASGMGQNFVQNGSARSGLISQGQSPSSGSTNFPRQ